MLPVVIAWLAITLGSAVVLLVLLVVDQWQLRPVGKPSLPAVSPAEVQKVA